MRERVYPSPFSFLSFNSAIFTFKKNKRGAGDSSTNGDEIYFEDDLRFKENGDIDYDGGATVQSVSGTMPDDPDLAEGVLEMNSKKIEDLNGSIQDIQGRLDKFEITMKGVKNDSDGIKDEIVQMNDSIKKMLCIYEAITQQYNPFIDDVPTASAPNRETTCQTMPARSNMIVEEEPLDRVIRPEDFEAEIESNDTKLGDVIGLNDVQYDPFVNRVGPKTPAADTNYSLSNEKMTVSLQKDTVTVTSAPARQSTTFQDACIDKMMGMADLMREKARLEELIERAFIQKVSGQPVSNADIEYLKDWCRKNGR